jgi:hypothetical protein
MSHKTQLMLYRQLMFKVGWVISLTEDDVIYISKNGTNMTVPELSGVNVHDLAPDVDIERLLLTYCTSCANGLGMSLDEFYKLPMRESTLVLETNSLEPSQVGTLGTVDRLKKGVMHVIGYMGLGKGQSKTKL